jgi:nucleotide-binding universal stress UspA family protein
MKKLLVAVDFSRATPKVVEQAKRIALSSDAEIKIIHVVAPEPDFIGDDVGPQVIRDLKAQKYRDKHKELQKIAGELKNGGIKITPILMQGVTVDSIIKEQKRFGADLIIIGSHGHGAMYNLLMGSVVEGVIRESKIPVLVVPVSKD